jgi:hypothetical protein
MGEVYRGHDTKLNRDGALTMFAGAPARRLESHDP